MLELKSADHQTPMEPANILQLVDQEGTVKNLFPQDKLKHWSSNGTDFEFQLQGLPQIGMERTEFSENLIKFKSGSNSPIAFEIFVTLTKTASGTTFNFSFQGDVNMGLQFMIKGPLQALIDTMANNLAKACSAPQA